ncbi:MAG: carboxylating nicotinate-nucleotide diphosphorylase [Propionibacteriaceae bacterium]|jgi:nicotinate-nucleotide pyrophosphorylase (carboxylating)|nr:carboxylating nicotinate-nucleotide diphosphorylase [Propionibacteriaceae bacterium]
MRPPPLLAIEPIVRMALNEDLSAMGDMTTDAIIPTGQTGRVALVAREPGVIAGADCAALAWRLVDPAIQTTFTVPDGEQVHPGDVIATATGPMRGLLSGERVALNFLGHLCGVATATATIAAAIAHTKAKVADTRKTMPGLRALQKYAVRAGGGSNHRFGLGDAVLIKDNHIAAVGGIAPALGRVKASVGHMVKIEVEVDTLDQLRELLALADSADAVLLDNMTPAQLGEAVALVDGRMITEASGRITPETARPIAEAGVDLISVGWLTHSARVLDIGLDYLS